MDHPLSLVFRMQPQHTQSTFLAQLLTLMCTWPPERHSLMMSSWLNTSLIISDRTTTRYTMMPFRASGNASQGDLQGYCMTSGGFSTTGLHGWKSLILLTEVSPHCHYGAAFACNKSTRKYVIHLFAGSLALANWLSWCSWWHSRYMFLFVLQAFSDAAPFDI